MTMMRISMKKMSSMRIYLANAKTKMRMRIILYPCVKWIRPSAASQSTNLRQRWSWRTLVVVMDPTHRMSEHSAEISSYSMRTCNHNSLRTIMKMPIMLLRSSRATSKSSIASPMTVEVGRMNGMSGFIFSSRFSCLSRSYQSSWHCSLWISSHCKILFQSCGLPLMQLFQSQPT